MKYIRKTMHLYAFPTTFKHAQALRGKPTPAESILWNRLRNKNVAGVKFRRQHPLNHYVADFYAHELKLVIEVDGEYHNETVQTLYDTNRTDILSNLLLTVLRFENQAVIQDTDWVVEQIRLEILELKSKKQAR